VRSPPESGPGAPSILPAGSRREDTIVLAATAALAILGLLILLGAGLPKILFAFALIAGAVLAFFRPEVGLYALLLNALVGLTHVAALPRIGPLSVPIAFELVLVLSIGYRAIFLRHRLFLASPQHLLFGLLTLWMFLSLLANGGVGPQNVEAIRSLYLVRVLIFFLLTNVVTTGAATKRLVVVLTASNAGLLVTSLLVRAGYFGAERLTFSEKILRTSGIVHNPNTLAFDLITLVILCAAAFLYVRHPLLKVLLALIAGFDLLAILTTLSRSGFVALCVVTVYLLWKLKRNWKAIAFVAALGILAVLLLPGGLQFRFDLVKGIKDIDRVEFARVALNTALSNPFFGVGWGNYIDAFPAYNNTSLPEPAPAHNMYLDLAAQIGFPALALYLLAFFLTWRRLAAMEADLKRLGGQRSFLYQFGWAVQACFVNLAVFGLSGDVEFEYSVFAVLGLGMLLYREHRLRISGGGDFGEMRRRSPSRHAEGRTDVQSAPGRDAISS